MDKIKVFISQPMSGLSQEEIVSNRREAVKRLMILLPNNIVEKLIINDSNYQFDKDPKTTKPLNYLGYDINLLADIDVIYFIEGWQNSKGCNIEYNVAKLYNIPMLFDYGNPINILNNLE